MRSSEYVEYLNEECEKTREFLETDAGKRLTHYERTLFEDAINKCIKSMIFIRTQRIVDYYLCVRCFLVKTGFHNSMCENCKEFYDYPTERSKKEELERIKKYTIGLII